MSVSGTSPSDQLTPAAALQQLFGLQRFHDGQREVIERLLAGRSAAAVFPTGGGKSLCYQLPAQLLPGLTVVVSPLMALMRDQCEALAAKGIRAARLDSSLSPSEYADTMSSLRTGKTKLLYVAPERFFNERFRASISGFQISLFAVDEAHCISRWGHNFRPDYLKLAAVAEQLRAERIVALTATATPEVLDDICAGFQIAAEDAIRTPFYRPNLQLRSCVLSESQRMPTLLARLQQQPAGPTIIYVSLQRTAMEVAERLADAGLPARPYHAGMDDQQRAANQQWFLESDQAIVVATIAFGMGIDKPNIRYVYHYNPPGSLEAYAQEIGRAGRDGQDSVCELLLVPDDRVVLENFTFGDTPTLAAVQRLVERVARQPETFFLSHYQLSSDTDIRLLVVKTLLAYLELDGWISGIAPRYDSYKIKPLVSSKHILSHFQGEPREFLAGMLACLTKGRTWFTLNMAVASKRLRCDRARLVKATEYLAEKGWIELQVSDLVHGYRQQRQENTASQAGSPPSRLASSCLEQIADQLHQRLVQREQAEVARLDDVFSLANATGCLAARLSQHFGETLDQPCGRCTHCLGDGPWNLAGNLAGNFTAEGGHSDQTAPARGLGSSVKTALDKLARQHPDLLSDPRNQARFLCGLSSPAFTRARLSRDPSYGVCEQIPFRRVLAALGG